MIRVAAAQCYIGGDIDENLKTCLRMLDKAAECSPDIVVLPEFCNHLSWYNDADHCWEVSLTTDHPFLAAIANKAKEIGAKVAIGATMRREDKVVTGSSLLFSEEGELLSITDKQVLIGHENDFLRPATEHAVVLHTEQGRLSQYMCMDGVIGETPRGIALRGAQVLLNSLNSFAPDEGNLHIPVRAAENKVFVVAANKIGPLVPVAMKPDISAATNIPEKFLDGAGDSQIVAPSGEVLAITHSSDEDVVFADIDPTQADNKLRPDGTDIFKSRRPELYGILAEDPAGQTMPEFKGADNLLSALLQPPEGASAEDIVALVVAARGQGARLITLPAMATTDSADLEQSASDGLLLVTAISKVLDDATWVVTSHTVKTDSGYQHQAICIGNGGVIARQAQVHASKRYEWSELADAFTTVEMPFGRLALMCGDDSIYPEAFRLVAMQGAEVVVVPLAPLEKWELETGLVERSAENRVNLLAPCLASHLGEGIGAALHEDFTIFGEWKTRAFDGVLTRPMLTYAVDGAPITLVNLHPINANNKVVSRNTHLIDNRPWPTMSAMVEVA